MTSANKFLPYGRQTIEEDDIAAVAAALKADYLTTGPLVEAFEQEFAQAANAEFAIACNSGTAALHLAALSLDLSPQDAVIIPTITFLATANAVRMTGAEIVFADVDPGTGLLTAATFEEALHRARQSGKKLRAAFPVHLNGETCDMAALAAIAAKNDVILVEDACHALGAADSGAAKHSHAACFSTHPVKAIATGEGGVVTTKSRAAAERMRMLRNHGMTREPAQFQNSKLARENGAGNPWYYEMQEVGWNYRMPDVLCALGISQLKKLPRFWNRRNEIAALYDELLKPLCNYMSPVLRSNRSHGWHLYVLRMNFDALGMTRAKAMEKLRSKGIGTQVHYIPVHLQPYYAKRHGELPLPGADAYYKSCLSIPIFPSMTDADVHRVVVALAELAGERA
jgi:UDP-4-amino-4,6-dideoxy-N-acetyl-beta-L-altrosamine transaminase